MTNEEKLSEQQSLELITSMINKAKCDYEETGIGALTWGIIIMLCSLVTFGNFYWQIAAFNYIWLLTIVAVTVQIIIAVRSAGKKTYKTYNDDAMVAVWTSFGVSVSLLWMLTAKYQFQKTDALFLILYGMPTFITGYVHNFKAMIAGGIIFWLCAVACFFISFPYSMLLVAGGAFAGWLLPGLLLRRSYVKAKQQHV